MQTVWPEPPPPPPATSNASTDKLAIVFVNVPLEVNACNLSFVLIVVTVPPDGKAATVILNCLVELPLDVAAVTVKVCVSFVSGVPVIKPVDELIDKPDGKEPVVTEYVIVSPSASVAEASSVLPDTARPLKTVPKEPAAVSKEGGSLTLRPDDNIPDNPEPFKTLTL